MKTHVKESRLPSRSSFDTDFVRFNGFERNGREKKF